MEIEKRSLERIIGLEEYLILKSALHQLEMFHPEKVFLFGSFATASFNPGTSDIDLCVVAETEDKRETLTKMYNDIKLDLPCDFLLYTPEEWARCVQDLCSFAHHIRTTGMMLVNNLAVMAVPGPPFIIKGNDKVKRFLSIRPNQKAVAAAKKRVANFNRIYTIDNPTPSK
jgi:predicted nucleotidyltransferase